MKLLRTLTINKGDILVPLIDAYQQKGKFPPKWTIEIINTKEDDPHFHPSGHGLVDTKTLWQELKFKQPKPVGVTLRRVFDAGHMWHNYYGNILTDMGLISPDNVERKMFYNFIKRTEVTKGLAAELAPIGAGTGDLVGVHIPGQGEWLVDMKTMRKDEFESGPTPKTFKKWEAQINLYGDWFELENMMILAIQKDSPHSLREFRVNRNEELLAGIYERWNIVRDCIRDNRSPEDLS